VLNFLELSADKHRGALVGGRFPFGRYTCPDYQPPAPVMAYDDGLFRIIDDEMQEALAQLSTSVFLSREVRYWEIQFPRYP
jgi:hypothetical protein